MMSCFLHNATSRGQNSRRIALNKDIVLGDTVGRAKISKHRFSHLRRTHFVGWGMRNPDSLRGRERRFAHEMMFMNFQDVHLNLPICVLESKRLYVILCNKVIESLV